MNRSAITLRPGADLNGFRQAVRALLAAGTAPDEVVWSPDGALDLFGATTAVSDTPVLLPRSVGELIKLVVCHRDAERYAMLYQLIWRVTQGEKSLLDNPADPLMHRLELMAKSIRRDLHKMHAFVRFRQVSKADGGERFVAWFEPDHFIVEATAGFFVERFHSMEWTIFTPVGSLHWDTDTLTIGLPGRKSDLPDSDSFEAGWCDYYQSTFNPARVNPVMMRGEMAKKYWKNLPEAAAIPDMIRTAQARMTMMVERGPAIPAKRSPDRAVAAMSSRAPATLAELNKTILGSPPLVPGATQAVLGEGPAGAAIAFVGEQPGDAEDLAGRPFVGPAGQLLDRAMAEAGLDRTACYITNAVKHFKFEAHGKRRIHVKPTLGEIKHYRWWLTKELDFVAPKLVVALGATALTALVGKALPLMSARGERKLAGRPGYVTVHPSYLLRLRDETAWQTGLREFISDLRWIRDSVL
jgi:DNA polymerase